MEEAGQQELFSGASASIATFTVYRTRDASGASNRLLPTPAERMALTPVSEGPLSLVRTQGNEIAYLHIGRFSHPVFRRSKIWRVNELDIVIAQPTPGKYWLINLTASPRSQSRLDRVFEELSAFECRFDQPEEPEPEPEPELEPVPELVPEPVPKEPEPKRAPIDEIETETEAESELEQNWRQSTPNPEVVPTSTIEESEEPEEPEKPEKTAESQTLEHLEASHDSSMLHPESKWDVSEQVSQLDIQEPEPNIIAETSLNTQLEVKQLSVAETAEKLDPILQIEDSSAIDNAKNDSPKSYTLDSETHILSPRETYNMDVTAALIPSPYVNYLPSQLPSTANDNPYLELVPSPNVSNHSVDYDLLTPDTSPRPRVVSEKLSSSTEIFGAPLVSTEKSNSKSNTNDHASSGVGLNNVFGEQNQDNDQDLGIGSVDSTSNQRKRSSSSSLENILDSMFDMDKSEMESSVNTSVPINGGSDILDTPQSGPVKAPPVFFGQPRFTHPLIPAVPQQNQGYMPRSKTILHLKSPSLQRGDLINIGPQSLHTEVTTVGGFIGWRVMNRILRRP